MGKTENTMIIHGYFRPLLALHNCAEVRTRADFVVHKIDTVANIVVVAIDALTAPSIVLGLFGQPPIHSKHSSLSEVRIGTRCCCRREEWRIGLT